MVDLGPVKTCHGYWPEPGVPCLRMLRENVCPKQADPHHGYVRQGPPDDPRWDWCNIQAMSDPEPVWIKGACRHINPDPITVKDPLDPGGLPILVAWWCQNCDHQFSPERFNWETDPFAEDDSPAPWTHWDSLPEPNGFERWAYAPSTVVELPQGADLERFVEAFHEAQAGSRPVVLPQGSGLHLTTSPGKEWWRQLPEGASARDVATINNRPVKVNPHGVLVYDQEPVYVAGGYIRPAPPRHPLWHRVLGNWCQVHLKVWNLIKSEAYWLWVPALAGGAVVYALVENGVWK